MKITEIRECVKNKNRVNLYSDGIFVCALFLDTVLENRITVGCNINDDDLQSILLEDEKKNALAAAFRFLNVRMQTKSEIEKKLMKKGFTGDACMYVVERLSELGYIDDYSFAEEYVNTLGHSHGRKMIEKKLFEKGVSRDIISEVCDSLEQQQTAVDYLESYIVKRGHCDDKIKLKQKAFRNMVARGFLYNDIKNALKTVFDDSDEIF